MRCVLGEIIDQNGGVEDYVCVCWRPRDFIRFDSDMDSNLKSKPNPLSAYAGIELMTVSTLQSLTSTQSYNLQPSTTSVALDKLLVSLDTCTAKHMERGLT